MKAIGFDLPPLPSLAWAYFLDVDGTLIDFAPTPDAIYVDQELVTLIGRLHQATQGATALVSGRALSDLDDHFRIAHVPAAGLHGLERRDATGRLWIHATPPAAKNRIVKALAPVLAEHPGLLLEDKGLTLALHYRAAPHMADYVRWIMDCLASQADEGLELLRGKFVAEIKPSGVDKGTAVAEYLAEPPFKGRRPVFIGDDLNDEHGFAQVNRIDGISIKVGKEPSCARFRLPDVSAVRRWLDTAFKEKS